MIKLFTAEHAIGTHVQLPVPAGARIINQQVQLRGRRALLAVVYEYWDDDERPPLSPSDNLDDLDDLDDDTVITIDLK